MVIQTYTPECEIRKAAAFIVTIAETIWRNLDENESDDEGPTALLLYKTMSRSLYLSSTAVQDSMAPVKLDKDDVRDAVMMFYVAAEKAWTYLLKEVEKGIGGQLQESNATALRHVAEDTLALCESWYKGRAPTKLKTTLTDLEQGEG